MPDKALKFCIKCGVLSHEQLCDKCRMEKQKQQDEQYSRASSSERGYDANWQKLRLLYLAKHPLCEQCNDKGLTVAATLVHHRKEISKGGAVYDTDNLMSLCNACHEEIHRYDRWKARSKG